MRTNIPSLKRTFAFVSGEHRQEKLTHSGQQGSITQPRSISRRMSFSLKRRFPFSRSPYALSSDDIILAEHPQPPFVPVTTDDMSGCQTTKEQYHNLNRSKTAGLPVMTGSLSLQRLENTDSGPASASSSNNPSPTTTVSTVDSATTENDTPSTSPNSPVMSIVPLSDFASKNNGGLSIDDVSRPPSSSHSYSTSTSPNKKPRNTKNLSVNVPPPAPSSRQQYTSIDPAIQHPMSARSMSAPNSPAFILPPPPPAPKRRPSNLGLTIKLPSSLPDRGLKNGLRHHQSSPSLFTPGPNGPPGGMKLPPHPRMYQPPRQSTFNSLDSLSSSLSSSSSVSPPRTPPPPLHEMDEEDEPLSNEASKSPAYPNGPICIFEPNVFLFAEPDADLASTFDVVINVAREVLNPFDVAAEKTKREREQWRMSIIPDTACTEASFATAFEEPILSPVKEEPKKTYKKPHYVHIPWDHNTSILDDLPELVKLISENASSGKRVLVHCQCGVSRSASLLIAYSLFKNPQQTVQEAYDSVKNRSKWIGPNMSLIYQLSDWRAKLVKDKGTQGIGNGGWKAGNVVGGVRGLVKGSRNFGRIGSGTGSMSADMETTEDLSEPLTAPLPQRQPPSSPISSSAKSHPVPQMVRTRSENGGFISGVAPGPSSAPPGMITIPKSSPPLPVKPDEKPWDGANVPPPLPPSAAYAVRPDNSDAPSTPTFKSPRNSGYFGYGIPIRRDVPGGLGFADPRSPNRGAETPIIRSIFDVFTQLWKRIVGWE